MSYLARLKRLDSDERFHHTSKHEPTKPTEPTFDGFVGSIPGPHGNIYSVNGNAEKPVLRDQEATILTWLEYIGEADSAIIAEVMDKCRVNIEALAYFLWRSEEVPNPEGGE